MEGRGRVDGRRALHGHSERYCTVTRHGASRFQEPPRAGAENKLSDPLETQRVPRDRQEHLDKAKMGRPSL